MIARTPEQRELHEARLKLQRDEAACLEFAMSEGIAKGRLEAEQIGYQRGEPIGQQIGLRRGELIGMIRLLQKWVGQPQSASEEFAKSGTAELQAQIAVLQRQLCERRAN